MGCARKINNRGQGVKGSTFRNEDRGARQKVKNPDELEKTKN
jgi:hypothetical protein